LRPIAKATKNQGCATPITNPLQTRTRAARRHDNKTGSWTYTHVSIGSWTCDRYTCECAQPIQTWAPERSCRCPTERRRRPRGSKQLCLWARVGRQSPTTYVCLRRHCSTLSDTRLL